MKLADFEYLTINTDNQNWYRGTGCQYPLICPKGTRVKFLGVMKNYYGEWFRVEHNGKAYYIYPEYCDGNVIVKEKIESMYRADLNEYITLTFLTDRYGKQYVMNENGEINPL
jgi:uncharacterized protein YraI